MTKLSFDKIFSIKKFIWSNSIFYAFCKKYFVKSYLLSKISKGLKKAFFGHKVTKKKWITKYSVDISFPKRIRCFTSGDNLDRKLSKSSQKSSLW